MEQQMVLPEGGLASFLTSNLDEIDDSRLAFGRQNGINSMRETAERMAQLGRNGDDVLIHATKKERLIPKEVSEANPELMTQVDIAIADAGADPSAYIVGSETNSVNPYTGQSEFFFKKLISNVKNIFKKVAPIIVPFALNFIAPGLGSIASGFIGSGITGLVQGKSFKDSLKMGVQGALIGGLTSGLRGGFSKGEGTFGQKFAQGIEQTGIPGGDIFRAGEEQNVFQYDPVAGEKAIKAGDPTFFDKVKDFALPKTQIEGGPKLSFLDKYGGTMATGAALALAGGAFDPIEQVPVEDPYSKESESERRLRLNPGKYTASLRVPRDNATLQDIMVGPVPELYKTNLYEQYMMPQQAAAGGQMESFPRRTGYIAGPGTETSDDIPAMLSDGEFVMNAQAVRGAGGGSREKGVRRMYDMMRAFEGGAVA